MGMPCDGEIELLQKGNIPSNAELMSHRSHLGDAKQGLEEELLRLMKKMAAGKLEIEPKLTIEIRHATLMRHKLKK